MRCHTSISFSLCCHSLPLWITSKTYIYGVQFIWNGKRPKIRLTTLQWPKLLYYWAFQIKAHTWANPEAINAWKMIETAKVAPHRLQDFLFTNICTKALYQFVPIIANSVQVWRRAERWMGSPIKFCKNTPLWLNINFLCGNPPFFQPSWSSLGINMFCDIYDTQGLCSIQDLRTCSLSQHLLTLCIFS